MRMVHISLLAVTLVAGVLLLPGCTTATYGKKPTVVTGQPDTFVFTIYMSAFAGAGSADKRLNRELERFKNEKGYVSHSVLDARFNPNPNGYIYTVRFSK